MHKTGQIKEILLDKYIVKCVGEDKDIEATIRGNVKKSTNVLVGDLVMVEETYDKNIITKVYNRKNSLIRPPVANIDNLVIVISLDMPKPDYMLLDKELILCFSKNIKPIIVVNKIDLDDKKENLEEIEYIRKVYEKIGIDVIYTSVINDLGIDTLKSKLCNGLSAFSGNSGVGKSSIIRKIMGDMTDENIKIGDIANKTKRGKHTTKYVKLYELEESIYVLDTPGFSSYELYDIDYKTIKHYYPEFKKNNCMYDDCMHINEDEEVCDIKGKIFNGEIDLGRYDRYVKIYNKLKELDDRKYK